MELRLRVIKWVKIMLMHLAGLTRPSDMFTDCHKQIASTSLPSGKEGAV